MKTLILSSKGQFITPDNVDRFLPKKLSACKIAYIITASQKSINPDYLEIHRKKMDELHLSYTEMDIAGKNEAELEKMFSSYDIILVGGGNTFYLLKAVRESGFENVIKKLIAKGVVYIGSSAGAYIACPSIIMATWTQRNPDRYNITEYTGMNLVPFLINAHYTPDELEFLKDNQWVSPIR